MGEKRETSKYFFFREKTNIGKNWFVCTKKNATKEKKKQTCIRTFYKKLFKSAKQYHCVATKHSIQNYGIIISSILVVLM